MPSRREIREAVVQFLYCADLEGGADPSALREPFWDFVTESDRRKLLLATYRTIHHLAHGREGRLEEWQQRQQSAVELLAGWPEAADLSSALDKIAHSESEWAAALARLERIPRDESDGTAVDSMHQGLGAFFEIDRALSANRESFLRMIEDHPALKGRLEAVAASTRRLQRISDRLRMVEKPEEFPDQADLSTLRKSKSHLAELRQAADQLVDQIIEHKARIDAALAEIVENYAPERIDPVDRSILRLATHEIQTARTPVKVAINEAVELAKRYGTSDSSRFVNGILDRLAHSGSNDIAIP